MKIFILSLILIFLSEISNAQQHDLNYYIAQAKANSPLINKSKNDNKLLELDLNQINKILTKPEVNFNANILLAPIISHDNKTNQLKLNSAGATNYTGYDLGISNGGQYQALVSVKQPLFTKSNYNEYAKNTDVLKNINNNKINLTNHELEYLIKNQYLLCIKYKKQSTISLELIKDLKNQLIIMQKLVDNAIYKQTDLMLLQIEYQNYKLNYKTYVAGYKNNLYNLNLISGINDTVFVDLKDVNFNLKPARNSTSDFMTSFKLDSLNILANQKISEQKYKPQVNIFADAGLNATYQPSFNRLGFSTGIALSLNIFDGNQKKINKEKSIIKLQTIQFAKKNFKIKNIINKGKILDQISLLNQKLDLVENQLKQYKILYDAYTKELSQGDVSIVDLKLLLKDITAKKQESLQLKMEKQALINSYNYWNF